MPPLRHLSVVVVAALTAWAAGQPAAAAEISASSAASASSQSLSASVGSLSNSLTASSNSSTGGGQTAEGPYRIERIAEAADRPLHVRLTLKPMPGTAGSEVLLTLPRATADAARLAVGGVVDARTRAYGIEFARDVEGRRDAFFLVVDDPWLHELPARPVSL